MSFSIDFNLPKCFQDKQIIVNCAINPQIGTEQIDNTKIEFECHKDTNASALLAKWIDLIDKSDT